MYLLDIDSQKLLLEKSLDPLPEIHINELKRIGKLDVSTFNEADVRAEIIDPIIRILGYQKGKRYSLDREKAIYFFGNKRRRIDYSITLWEKNFWLIEAKKPMPQENAFDYDTIRQAVEYAIHPEIEAALVVLCDGIKIVIFDREQNINTPLIQISISNIVNDIDSIRKLLEPMQIWFFYRRRIIKSIDRALEHEGNQNRINEFKNIIESRLNEKRGQIFKNLSEMELEDDLSLYLSYLQKASIDDIVDIQFFKDHSVKTLDTMINQ